MYDGWPVSSKETHATQINVAKNTLKRRSPFAGFESRVRHFFLFLFLMFFFRNYFTELYESLQNTKFDFKNEIKTIFVRAFSHFLL